MDCEPDGRCTRWAEDETDLSEFERMEAPVSDPNTLPNGMPRLITAHFEPDQTRYGDH